VADKGSDMVIKFNSEGRVAMVFGRKQEASDEKTGPLPHPNPPLPPIDGMFRQVTDMAWDKSGNTYISDGYINSRIAKFDKNGKWIKAKGTSVREKLASSCSIATTLRTAHRKREAGIRANASARLRLEGEAGIQP
jgi:hypothetical protein